MQISAASGVAEPRETIVVDLQGGISSSREAAAIKFELEALSGVHSVHFLEEGISVWINEQGVSVDVVRDTLVTIGIDQRSIAFPDM